MSLSLLRRRRPIRLRPAAAALALTMATGCAVPPPAAAPPLAAGQSRLWFYRDFIAGDTMSAPAVAINAQTIGHAYPGVNFYRDMPAGHYLVTVETVGLDVGQSQELALAPGEQEYVKIMSLPSWSVGFKGDSRPTYYARAVAPQIAAAELPLTSYRGGN